MSIEAQINVTFEDDSNLTFEEEFDLRERWSTLYTSNTDSLIEAYNLVGARDQLDFMKK